MLTLRSQPREEADLCQALLAKSVPTAQHSALPPPWRQWGSVQEQRPKTGRKFACLFNPASNPSPEVFIILLPNRLSPMVDSSPFFPLLILTQFQINIFQEITYLIPCPSYPCLWLRNEHKHKTSCDGLKIESRFKVLFFCPKAAKALVCFNFCYTHCFLLSPSLPSSRPAIFSKAQIKGIQAKQN